MTYTVYSLDYNGVPVYVGITRQPLYVRLGAHICCAKSGYSGSLYSFIRNNGKPEISYIDSLEADSLREAEKLEKFWIEQMRQWGFLLYNRIGVLGRALYLPKQDETMYRLYVQKRWKIPSRYLWVKEWLSHPQHPSNHLIVPVDAVRIRNEIFLRYLNR